MRKLFSIGAALVFASAVAFASVTFDPATGTGFVGKGDVQLAFGWNNQALQQNANTLTFSYQAEEQYKYDCTFTVEVGKDKVREPRTQNRGKDSSVSASVAYDARRSNQITGFNLTGFGPVTTTGEVPENGGSCPGGPFNDGMISNVELISSTGGLRVQSGGTSVVLQ
jgi:alpha-glucuronidase